MALWILKLMALVIMSWTSIGVRAQMTCSNGVQVYQRSPSNSIRLEVHADRIIEVAASEVPTSACRRVCDSTPSCKSFSVDHTTRTCKIFSVTVPRAKFIQRPGASFFEKICLPNASADRIRQRCGSRMWSVDRITGLAFNAFVNRVVEDVDNVETCIRHCLEETSFDCASVTYDDVTETCALSAEDRHTQPTAISENARSSDYFENKCVNNLIDCKFVAQSDIRVVSVDYVTVARSEEDCRDDCQKNTAMICRSYSHDVAQNSCSLSSDNSLSLLGVDLPIQNGHMYGERQCQHVSPSASFATNQIPLSLQATAFSTGSGGGLATVSSNQFLPTNFGNQSPPTTSDRFSNNFDSRGRTPNPFFPPQNAGSPNPLSPGTAFGGGGSFNNPFFSGQPFDRRFLGPGTDPRMFGNPRDGSFNPNAQFPNSFPPTSDACSLEKSTGLTVMPDPRGMIPTDGLGRGVTVQCALLCRLQGPSQCPAFTVDYASNQCVILNRPASTALSTGSTPTQSYFEQVCYNTAYRTCQGKAWAFERILSTELRGFDDRLLPSIASRRECEEACLKETQFPCLSAEYDGNRLECRLSRENRLTRSYALQQSSSVDYLENQCVPQTVSTTCNPARQQGQAVFYVDTSLPQVFTEDECNRICRAFPNFTCLAASFSQTTRECQLSNDVTVYPQADSVLLYSSCRSLVQVAAPNFGNIGQSFGGNAFGNQFPGSFNSPGFTGSGADFPAGRTNFPAGGSNFPAGGSNFGGGFGVGGNPQSSGFTPNQFQGNFNPALNTGFSQSPFFNPTFNPQQIPQFFGSRTNTFGTSNNPQAPFGTTFNPMFANQNPQFSPNFPNQNPQFATNFPNQNPQFSSSFPNQTPQFSANFPSQNPQFFGFVGGTSPFIPQQNPQFFGTGNVQPFPTASGTFSQGSFPSQNFGSTRFPQTGQASPFGVQILPGGVQQQQFPSSSPSSVFGQKIEPSFRQGSLSTRAQNPRRASGNQSRPLKRTQNGEQTSHQTVKETKQDDVYISWMSESSSRKPIRNAPRFMRAEPNATQPSRN